MGTYSFLDVQATLSGPGGSINLGNGAAAADEGITVEFDEDRDTMTTGADGTPMHSLHASKAGKMTVRLLKTSPVNAQLSQMAAVQFSSAALHGANTLTVNDTSRGDNVSGRQVAFAKHSPVTYAKDAGMNEWPFNIGVLDITLGAGIQIATA